MENNIQIFRNPQFGEVRVVELNSEPMFCLSDVCKMLDIKNVSDCKSRLNPKGIAITDTPTKGGNQQMVFISEANLYKCIFQSRMPDAEKMQDWVYEDILPSVRKHGAYMTQDTIQKALTNPDFLIQLATELKVEQQRRIEAEETSRLQQEQLKLAAPKVQYVDEVLQSVNTYNVNLIAKELGMSAETLNKKMHDMKIIYRNGQTWVLTSKYQGKGFTKTRTHSFTRSDGSIGTSMLTVWTETGRQFIHSLFKS